MQSSNHHPSCIQCCTAAAATCINCQSYFCRKHFNEHYQVYRDYLHDSNRSFNYFLRDRKTFESKLEQEITQWEEENVAEIRKLADQARRALHAHLNDARSQFQEECHLLENSNVHENEEYLVSRLEKLHLEYLQTLKGLHLNKTSADGARLMVECKSPRRERASSFSLPDQSDNFVPQTPLGERLLRGPSVTTPVGSYWAMGGSDQYLLLQEYESEYLTLFDSYGKRGISLPWPNSIAIRDINWYQSLKQFIILLDKKIMLFDPLSKNLQEITQVKPYQSYSFRRFTCTNDHIYLVYWGLESVVESIRISNWETDKRWLSPMTCRVNEAITALRWNSSQQLGLAIQDENNPLNRRFRFEIRDLSLTILHTLPLYVDSGIFTRLAALPDCTWALLNVDETFIFIINEAGELVDKVNWDQGPLFNISVQKIKTYTSKVHCLNALFRIFFYFFIILTAISILFWIRSQRLITASSAPSQT